MAEQRHRCREPVHEVSAADRSELAGSEEPADGNGADCFFERGGIVVDVVEEPGSPAIAREHQGRLSPAGLEERAQLEVGRLGIAEVEADRAAQGDLVVHGHGPGRPVDARRLRAGPPARR